MANIENIFRFISLRPPTLERQPARLNMYAYNKDNKSELYGKVMQAMANGANREVLARLGTEFKVTANYVNETGMVKFPVSAMLDLLNNNARKTFQESNFVQSLLTIAQKNSMEDLLADHDFETVYLNLCDSVFADILMGAPVNEKEEKITAIKILYTLRAVGAKTMTLADDETIGVFFGTSTVIFPLLKPAQNQDNPVPDPPPDNNDQKDEKKKRAEYLNNLGLAHRELSVMAKDDSFRRQEEPNAADEARIKELEARVSELANKCKETGDTQALRLSSNAAILPQPTKVEFLLSDKGYSLLTDNTKKILSDFHFEAAKISPLKAVSRIEDEIRYIQSNVPTDVFYNKVISLGGIYIDQQKFKQSLAGLFTSPGTATWNVIKKCTFKAGIGDLLIVRQTLKAYELAEFADVENALAGEFRERVHKRLDLTEVITDTTTETETEKERDLQSTERNEMQTEAEKVVQDQAHVDAGLQVSGSYGPSVSFTASLNAGFSTSVQETQKKSTSYSREVTDKTTEKVRSKVTEEQRRRVLQQIEETNTHRIDNTAAGAKHVRGIYRWLNKIYSAQIYNYGQRMMYEFVIPEPAAFFLYATVDNPPVDTNLVKPDLPTFPLGGGAPLKPSNLTRTNFNDYVSKYNVAGSPEPPSAFTVKTFFDKQDGSDTQNFGRSGAISIPDGYEAYGVIVKSDLVWEDGVNHAFRPMVGDASFDHSNVWGAEYKAFNRTYRGEISVAYELMQVRSFSLGIDVFCNLTDEALTKWQIKMYDAIIQAYLDQKAAYDSKVAEKQIQQGDQVLGRNPDENRRIEKEELKKLIIMILTNTPFLNINSYLNTMEPFLDLSKVCPNGSYIRFFENAFEWENIVYVFYPYFWGRHAKWINAIHLTDPDLDFAAFLKAGAARVQIPVRPGFEKAVAFYCQTGIIWDGNDVPVIGDDLYVPIITEISENLGKLDDGVYYPDPTTPSPWEVTVPTSLVVLQDLREIPNIRDMMTGQNINLLPQ